MKKILPQAQIQFWDNFSGEFKIQPPLEKFSELVAKDKLILDIGCGYGRILDILFKEGYKNLYGIDASNNMIKQAQQNLPELTNNLQHITDPTTPFANHMFDAVLLVAVLTCIPSDIDQTLLLQEVKRVLKPGGILMISDFLIADNERNQERYQKYETAFDCYGVFKMADDQVVCRHHTLEHLKKLLTHFDIVLESSQVYTSMWGNQDKSVHIIARYTQSI